MMGDKVEYIFDWKESECSIVWNLYREAELKKFRIPKDSEEVDIDSLPWYKRLFHRLSSLNQRLYVVAGGDNEPFMPLRKYIIWLQRSSLKIDDAEIVDPVAFQRFFIRKVRNTAVFVLAVNFLVLINLVIALQLECFAGSSLSPKSPLVIALCGYFGTWAFINFICLLYFIVSSVISREKMAHWGISMDSAWLYVGRCVLLIWFAIIAQDTIAYVTSEHSAQCYGIDDIGERSAHVFWYIFATTLEDGIQSLALSCMPFPWPWGAVLAILMFYQTVLRTVTCSEYLAIPMDVKGRVIEGFNVVIFVYYLIIVSLTSYTFRRSVLSSYSNAVNQRAIAHNTRAMVDLLCTDVKVNVRRVLKTLDSMSQYTPPTVTSFAPLTTKMKESGVVINTAVDHLIFLAKLGEGRFEFFMEDKIVLSTAMVGVCKDYKRKALMDNRNIDLQVELSPDHLLTDARCLNALVYYGLMTADAYVQAMITRAVSLGRPTPTSAKHFFVKTQLESPRLPSATGLQALRIVIFFERIDPSVTIDESKQIVNDNAVIHSCCIVCHRLVQSYEGEFLLTPSRLECTLPVLPLGPKSPAHPSTQAPRLNRTSSVNSISTTSRLFFAPQSTYREESARNSAVVDPTAGASSPTVRLGQLLSEHTSMYLTLPNVESLVIDALHSLLQTQDPLNITIHRILNPVDLKIRAIVFVQTSQARHELIEAGFNGDIVLCSEKAGYFDARERALFSLTVSLPPSKDELLLLHRFLMRRLQRVHRANSSASDSPPNIGKDAASPGFGPSAMRRSSSFWGLSPTPSQPTVAPGVNDDLRLNNSSSMADIVVPQQSFGVADRLRRGWSWIVQLVSIGPRLPRSPPPFPRQKPARLAPSPSPSWFSQFFNAAMVTVPEHQLDNFAKWRFMNPGGDIYHHTVNVEFFTIFMGALFVYEWVKGLGSVRIVAISGGWALLLIYRKSMYFVLARFLSFVSFWVIFSFVNSAMVIPVTFASVGRIIAQDIRYQSVDDLFMDRSFVETMIRNGIQIVFVLISLPLNLKYFGEFLSWPISLITIVSQIGRGFFFIFYVLEPFLKGFIQRLVLALLFHMYVVVLINIISSEALFRDEFCQLHELIVSRSYLEKCLVLARQLVQPLKNVLDAQEELLDCIVTEAVGGHVLVHELFLGAMRDIQLSSLMMEHLHLDLRMTQEQDWLMQQERSVLIGRMRTVLLPCVVQDVCACFQEECYGLGIEFCMRFAPEVTQIRVEESLLRTTLAELCRRALEHVQEHIYLARKWSPSSDYWAKQLNRRHQMLLWVYPVSPLAAETGRPYRFTDIRDFEILLMTSADATPEGYKAMSQQHQNTGKVTASFFASAGVPLTMEGSVELQPFDRNPRTYYRRSMADLYAEYFGFVKHSNPQLQRPTAAHAGYRRDRNHEEGLVLRHASYRSYQRVLLPYLLTPRSIWFAQDIIKTLRATAQVGKMLDSSSVRYYATYARFAVPHFQLHVQPSLKLKRPPQTLAPLPPSTVAGATAATEPRINRITLDVHQPSMAPSSANANAATAAATTTTTAAATAAAAIAAAERRGARKKSNYYASPSSSFRLSPNSSLSAMAFAKFKVQQAQSVPPSLANTSPTQSSSVLAMNLTGVSMANLAPLPYASTVISTARSSSEASTSTSDSSDDDASAALALLAAAGSPLTAFRPPISFRGPGMHVAVVFSFPDTPLRQQAVHNQLIFGAVGWLGRLEMLRPPAMPLGCPGAEAECVFLEYVAPPVDTVASASLAPRLPPSPFRSFGFNHQPIAADAYFNGDSLEERLDNGRDYLRLVIQCLRYRGYEGLIVLVGPESVAAAMQADTYAVEDLHTSSATDDTPSSASAMAAAMASSSATKPLPAWTQRVAVKADRFLTTPLTEEKLQSLIPDCERRVVELALGVWRMQRR